MASGRRRSSIGRFLSAFAPKPIDQMIDLSPLECDLLVSYQLSLPQHSFLGPLAFVSAKVVSSEQVSSRIHNVLFKLAIINPPATDPSEVYMAVDTTKITRNFANQLYFCNAYTLRRIISLLFVFEEQCVRWRLLDNEEREIKSVLAQPPEGLEEEFKLRLQAVRGQRALLPSQQGQPNAHQEVPPAYC